jgi:hypothetical protein
MNKSNVPSHLRAPKIVIYLHVLVGKQGVLP